MLTLHRYLFSIDTKYKHYHKTEKHAKILQRKRFQVLLQRFCSFLERHLRGFFKLKYVQGKEEHYTVIQLYSYTAPVIVFGRVCVCTCVSVKEQLKIRNPSKFLRIMFCIREVVAFSNH